MAFATYFNVLGAYADLALKQIIVETNFKIEPSSINMDNIILYKVLDDDKNTHEIVKLYSLSLDKTGKNIIIQFENYPANNSKYYVIVKNLIDKLGRELYNNYDKYIKFLYNVKTKVTINNPIDQSVLKDNNIEFKIATSCEDEEIKYRIEISHDVAFFKSDYIILSERKEDFYSSNKSLYNIIGCTIDGNEILSLINFKEDGQYFLRSRAEKESEISGKWSEIISFSISTAKSAMSDDSGFLNDFLYSDVIYEEDLDPLEVLNATKDATTNQQFYIEFNKDIKFEQNLDSQYSNDGLLYIGKAYMVRRDL